MMIVKTFQTLIVIHKMSFVLHVEIMVIVVILKIKIHVLEDFVLVVYQTLTVQIQLQFVTWNKISVRIVKINPSVET